MKRKIQKEKKSKKLSTIQLIFLLILSAVVSATLLRINNVKMIKRRDAVLNADKKGDMIDLEERLYELQNYTYSHMNANTGPFTLEHSYRRDAQEVIDSISVEDNNDENKYAEIRRKCDAKIKTGNRRIYLNCYKTELAKIGSSDSDYSTEVKVKLPNINLYRKDYSSPAFSFDWAGISIIFTTVIALILIKRIAVGIFTIVLIKVKTNKNS